MVLMLTVKAPTQEALWRRWIPPHSKILVNSKEWRPPPDDAVFELIKKNVTDTEWGKVMEAQEALYQEGMQKFPRARHFVLVSGDSAPVKSYSHFVDHFRKYNNQTLMSRLDVRELDSRKSVSILGMLQDAKRNGIELGWWDTFVAENKDIPAAAQWSALSNEATRALVGESLTARSKKYDEITRQLGIFGKFPTSDETVTQAILARKNLPINLNEMSPMWVRHDRNDTTLEWPYHEAMQQTFWNPTWIFARKIKPLTAYSKPDVAMMKEKLGVDVPLPPAASTHIHVLTVRRNPERRFRDLAMQ